MSELELAHHDGICVILVTRQLTYSPIIASRVVSGFFSFPYQLYLSEGIYNNAA